MKRLSFRILFLCILLPPVLYVFSIQALEALIQKNWTTELEKRLVSDPSALLQGHIRIQDEVQRNIERYLDTQYATKLGVIPRIVVKTKTGTWLYPRITPEAIYPFDFDMAQRDLKTPGPLEPIQLARENLKIMEEGMSLSVTVQIPRNTWLANSVLVFYIFMFTFVLYYAYRASAREIERLGLRNREALEAANAKLTEAQQRLRDAADKEGGYQKEIENLRGKVEIAGAKVRNIEDEALAEMEALEEKLRDSIAFREKVEKEVTGLGQELEHLESSQKATSKKQQKQVKGTMKRFTTLYKNLEFDPRAVEGFLNLPNELHLRAEEFIHNMNEDSSTLTVRRKVFSKKGALPVLECEFAYRGRIYWRLRADGKAQILAIGSKNTQAKDLAYLERLLREQQ
jgi:hypothetical protein